MVEVLLPSSVREEFPVMETFLYLDSAHQTPLCNSVKNALIQFLQEGSLQAGPKPVWMREVESARLAVAKLLNADIGEIAFTKNTSEGLNIAANAIPLKKGDQVLMIEGDHPNNTYAWLNLQRNGIEVKFIPLVDCEVANAATFAPYVTERTRVITLSHVTFHAGQRHDIADIGALCRNSGIYLVVDAMQSVGVLPVDVKALGVSVLAAGCHKGLLVPQGLGILYVDEALQELHPVFIGMGSMASPPEDYIARPQDMVLRSDAGRFEMGNYNLPDLRALNAALGLVSRWSPAHIEANALHLGDLLIQGLDELGIRLVGPRERAHRAHIYVMDLPVAEWAEYLGANGVRTSPERGGIRISFGAFNTPEDVARLLRILQEKARHQA